MIGHEAWWAHCWLTDPSMAPPDNMLDLEPIELACNSGERLLHYIASFTLDVVDTSARTGARSPASATTTPCVNIGVNRPRVHCHRPSHGNSDPRWDAAKHAPPARTRRPGDLRIVRRGLARMAAHRPRHSVAPMEKANDP